MRSVCGRMRSDHYAGRGRRAVTGWINEALKCSAVREMQVSECVSDDHFFHYPQALQVPRGAMKPLITALVDTYNHERYIEQALVSILEQGLSPAELEIVVVDDG